MRRSQSADALSNYNRHASLATLIFPKTHERIESDGRHEAHAKVFYSAHCTVGVELAQINTLLVHSYHCLVVVLEVDPASQALDGALPLLGIPRHDASAVLVVRLDPHFEHLLLPRRHRRGRGNRRHIQRNQSARGIISLGTTQNDRTVRAYPFSLLGCYLYLVRCRSKGASPARACTQRQHHQTSNHPRHTRTESLTPAYKRTPTWSRCLMPRDWSISYSTGSPWQSQPALRET